MYTHIYTHLHTCVHVYMYIYIYNYSPQACGRRSGRLASGPRRTGMGVCVYIYIYIHTYIIYIYIYILYICRERERERVPTRSPKNSPPPGAQVTGGFALEPASGQAQPDQLRRRDRGERGGRELGRRAQPPRGERPRARQHQSRLNKQYSRSLLSPLYCRIGLLDHRISCVPWLKVVRSATACTD